MQITRKKPSWVWIIAGACLFAYLGYLLGGIWKEGMQLAEFLEACRAVRDAPFDNYMNEHTWKAVVIALLVYAAAVLMYCTGQRNYMPGKEYGSAKFADVRRVNQVLADKDPCYNRILSRHVRMSLDTRHTKLNNNVLIIGGSGAGKTFYEVKPNLMQMPHHCSFICTDPKGEILRSCGQMLKDNGYRVKVINLLEMDRSD